METNSIKPDRIAFLCGCLEPGRDGVGDYTRLLASECAKQGSISAIVALNDRFIKKSVESNIENSAVKTLRLPAALSWSQRAAAARKFLENFQPAWTSLQFVPYGFASKGLIFGLKRHLRDILAGASLQIMFHELWIGESAEYDWKDRMIGAAQKYLILDLARSLAPAIVHTSIPIYRHMLTECGIFTRDLPLFGNIPISNLSPEPLLPQLSRDSNDPSSNPAGAIPFFIGLFGTIHPQWDPMPTLDSLIDLCSEVHRSPVLITMGRIGGIGNQVLTSIEKRYFPALTVINAGEHRADRISAILQSIDLGICTSPWALVGKSGTGIAMLEHGLPVLVPRDDWSLRGRPTPPPAPENLLFRPGQRFATAFRQGLPRSRPASRLSGIAARFLGDLSGVSPIQTDACLRSPHRAGQPV